MEIEDGRGKGYQAGVNSNNRVMASSIVLDAIDNATSAGESFNITTDVLTLTNGNVENGILYITNTNTLRSLSLSRVAISIGKSNVTGDVIVRFYTNPTGGTLLTATDVSLVQRNFGSRYIAQASAKKMSAVAQTVTGGTLLSTRIIADSNTAELNLGLQIPAGSSFAMTITPLTGNTSMRCAVTASVFYLEAD